MQIARDFDSVKILSLGSRNSTWDSSATKCGDCLSVGALGLIDLDVI